MIKYALLCEHEHPFEGWFSRSEDFDEQQSRGLLDCPVCASKAVRKAVMAPAVQGTKAKAAQPTPEMRQMIMHAMHEVRQHVEENFDYVGDQFAKEARAIHEGSSDERGIYGEASPTEVRALIEDGIRVAPLPPKPPEKRELN